MHLTSTLVVVPSLIAKGSSAGKGHGKAVDWWSIGILVYEMLAGRPPFNNKSRGQLQKQIMAAKLKLPREPSVHILAYFVACYYPALAVASCLRSKLALPASLHQGGAHTVFWALEPFVVVFPPCIEVLSSTLSDLQVPLNH